MFPCSGSKDCMYYVMFLCSSCKALRVYSKSADVLGNFIIVISYCFLVSLPQNKVQFFLLLKRSYISTSA